MKRLAALVVGLLGLSAFGASDAADFPARRWNPSVHRALVQTVERHRGDARAYAVFDFDLTSALCDIEHVAMDAAIRNLEFAFSPEDWERTFLRDVADAEMPLAADAPQATVRNVVLDCADLHRELLALRRTQPMDVVRRTEAFEAFSAKVRYLRECGAYAKWGFGFSLPWIKRLFEGQTPEAFRAALQREIARCLREQPYERKTWRTPVSRPGRAGAVSITVTRGLTFPDEMADLFRVLRESGIAVYVVSGGYEEAVRAAVAALGLGIPAERVYGFRLKSDARGRIVGETLPGAPFTWAKGKPVVIRTLIAPQHGGAEPILVAGDSNGDHAMLTAFPKMENGLVFDTHPAADSALGQLLTNVRAGKLDGRYLIQERDETTGRFLPFGSSRAHDSP